MAAAVDAPSQTPEQFRYMLRNTPRKPWWDSWFGVGLFIIGMYSLNALIVYLLFLLMVGK